MGLRDRLDALPIDRIQERVPSVWQPADDEGEDAATARDDPAVGGPEVDGPASTATGTVPGEDAPTFPDEEADDEGTRLRTVLLGVSLGSGVVAIATAVIWRLLGRGEDDEETPVAAAPEPPATPEPAVEREEGAAALVGLGFGIAVAALRRRLSSPTK